MSDFLQALTADAAVPPLEFLGGLSVLIVLLPALAGVVIALIFIVRAVRRRKFAAPSDGDAAAPGDRTAQ